jgi:hypothetical protein
MEFFPALGLLVIQPRQEPAFVRLNGASLFLMKFGQQASCAYAFQP